MSSGPLLEKYPRTKRYLQETGYTLDQALAVTENELIKLSNKIKRMGGNEAGDNY